MGEIITFYSYKGGTGRTMALANTACLLAEQTRGKVLVIDWDLEAPGLFSYFEDFCAPECTSAEGLVEYMLEITDILENSNTKNFNDLFYNIEKYLIRPQIKDIDNLFLLKAGNEDESPENKDELPESEHESYSDKLQKINWIEFFSKNPTFFTAFASYLSNKFDYVLIDSRTGHTDTGGICTMLMPDKLVLAFTPNKQSLNGVVALAHKAVKYRHGSSDIRPLKLYPLPSRVDLEAQDLKADWQTKYHNAFTKLFEEIYQLPWISLDSYFDKVQIRHSAEFAYEEKIAVLDDKFNGNSIKRDFKEFSIQLNRPKIWEDKPFKSLDEPLKALVIYSSEDKEFYETLLRSLVGIRRQGGIIFGDDIPIEKWSEADKKLNGGFDVIFEIISPTLLQYKLQLDDVNKVDDVTHISILARHIDETVWNSKNTLPKNNIPLSASENQDESWYNLTNEINHVILDTIYDKLKTSTHA